MQSGMVMLLLLVLLPLLVSGGRRREGARRLEEGARSHESGHRSLDTLRALRMRRQLMKEPNWGKFHSHEDSDDGPAAEVRPGFLWPGYNQING